MKKQLFVALAVSASSYSFAQTNAFPSSGDAEIKSGQLLIETNNWRESLLTFRDIHYTPAQVYKFQLESDGLKIKQDNSINYQFLSGGNFIVNKGNVGIGTTSPSYKLVVNNGVTNLMSPYYGIPTKGSIGNGTSLFISNNDPLYGILGGVHGSGDGWLQVQRIDGHATAYNLNLQPNGGNVGIGTTSPSYKLHVSGDIKVDNGHLMVGTHNTMGYGSGIVMDGNSDAIWINRYNIVPDISELRVNIGDDSNDRFTIGHTFYQNGNWVPSVSVTASGQMGVGTYNIPSGYRLAVGGNIIAEKVKVQLQPNWPDYVFEPTYKLLSIKEVEQYIKQYKHLPDVPSAKEVEKNGLDVGESQATLLKKIEEITLYVIELKNENEKMSIKIEEQQKEIQALKSTKINNK